MKKNKVNMIIIAFILCINYTYGTGYYLDMNNHWSSKYVYWATNDVVLFKNYLDDSFKPDSPMSRGEYIYLLDRVLEEQNMYNNKKMDYSISTYTDIDEKHWGYKNVISLISYIDHYANSDFNFYDIFPSTQLNLNKVITRNEAALLARSITTPPILEKKGYSYKDLSPSIKNYNAIKELVDNNIMAGYGDNTFRLNNKITRGEAAAIAKKVYDDLQYLQKNYMKIRPIETLYTEEAFPLFQQPENNSLNMSYDDKIYVNAVTSLEYLSFIGYIPYEERHLYDLNPIDTLWELKNKDYYNTIGVNYYLLKRDKDLVLERKKELIAEAIQHYSSIQDKNLEGIYNFFKMARQYYANKDLMEAMESIYFNTDDQKGAIPVGILLTELYLEEKRFNDAILIYQQLLTAVDDIEIKMEIISNYIFLIFETSGYDKALGYSNDLWTGIRGHRQYISYRREIDDTFIAILKQLKIKTKSLSHL